MEVKLCDLQRKEVVSVKNGVKLGEKEHGDMSGWMYRVDGEFPDYGCSRYVLHDGQVVEWVYTCDLGRDVGCMWVEGAIP